MKPYQVIWPVEGIGKNNFSTVLQSTTKDINGLVGPRQVSMGNQDGLTAQQVDKSVTPSADFSSRCLAAATEHHRLDSFSGTRLRSGNGVFSCLST